MKTKKQRKKYVSVKLPAHGRSYPLDTFGCHKLPDYTAEYLKKHGQKLFKILTTKVPSKVYSEVLKLIRELEKI